MSHIFVACPAYVPITDAEVRQNVEAEKLVARGHGITVGVLSDCALIDRARSELLTMFLASDAEYMLCIDRDVKVTAESILDMLAVNLPIVSAPCKMRSGEHLYNVVPNSDVTVVEGVRTIQCFWTGLGCVLVQRRALMRMCELSQDPPFFSYSMPGKVGYNLYGSLVVSIAGPGQTPAYDLIGDDRAFSYRATRAGIKIHATIDAKTNHRGLEGCMGDDMRKTS